MLINKVEHYPFNLTAYDYMHYEQKERHFAVFNSEGKTIVYLIQLKK